MSDIDNLYPIAIVEDRYGGVYSGGKWIAIADHTESYSEEDDDLNRYEAVMAIANGGDGDADDFWRNPNKNIPSWIAVGNTPKEAYENLKSKNGIFTD